MLNTAQLGFSVGLSAPLTNWPPGFSLSFKCNDWIDEYLKWQKVPKPEWLTQQPKKQRHCIFDQMHKEHCKAHGEPVSQEHAINLKTFTVWCRLLLNQVSRLLLP